MVFLQQLIAAKAGVDRLPRYAELSVIQEGLREGPSGTKQLEEGSLPSGADAQLACGTCQPQKRPRKPLFSGCLRSKRAMRPSKRASARSASRSGSVRSWRNSTGPRYPAGRGVRTMRRGVAACECICVRVWLGRG